MQTQKSRATVESRQHANVKECIAILSWTEFFFLSKGWYPSISMSRNVKVSWTDEVLNIHRSL